MYQWMNDGQPYHNGIHLLCTVAQSRGIHCNSNKKHFEGANGQNDTNVLLH